jgi:hypothetical protein
VGFLMGIVGDERAELGVHLDGSGVIEFKIKNL